MAEPTSCKPSLLLIGNVGLTFLLTAVSHYLFFYLVQG